MFVWKTSNQNVFEEATIIKGHEEWIKMAQNT